MAHGTGGSAVERKASGHPEQSLQDVPKIPQGLVGRASTCSETDSGGSLPMAARSPWEESVHLTPACGKRVVSGFPEPCKPAREGSSQSALLAHPPTLPCPVSFAGSRPRLSSLSITPPKPALSCRGEADPRRSCRVTPFPPPPRTARKEPRLRRARIAQGFGSRSPQTQVRRSVGRALVGRINCGLIESTNLLSPEPATRGGFVLPLVAVSR